MTKGDSLTTTLPLKPNQGKEELLSVAREIKENVLQESAIKIRVAVAVASRKESGSDIHCRIVDFIETSALELSKLFEKRDKGATVFYEVDESQKVIIITDGKKFEYAFEPQDVLWILNQRGEVLNALIGGICEEREVSVFTDLEGKKSVLIGEKK